MYVLEGHWHGVFSMDVQKFKWVLTIGESNILPSAYFLGQKLATWQQKFNNPM
jgi:hypothetical protein